MRRGRSAKSKLLRSLNRKFDNETTRKSDIGQLKSENKMRASRKRASTIASRYRPCCCPMSPFRCCLVIAVTSFRNASYFLISLKSYSSFIVSATLNTIGTRGLVIPNSSNVNAVTAVPVIVVPET